MCGVWKADGNFLLGSCRRSRSSHKKRVILEVVLQDLISICKKIESSKPLLLGSLMTPNVEFDDLLDSEHFWHLLFFMSD